MKERLLWRRRRINQRSCVRVLASDLLCGRDRMANDIGNVLILVVAYLNRFFMRGEGSDLSHNISSQLWLISFSAEATTNASSLYSIFREKNTSKPTSESNLSKKKNYFKNKLKTRQNISSTHESLRSLLKLKLTRAIFGHSLLLKLKFSSLRIPKVLRHRPSARLLPPKLQWKVSAIISLKIINANNILTGLSHT